MKIVFEQKNDSVCTGVLLQFHVICNIIMMRNELVMYELWLSQIMMIIAEIYMLFVLKQQPY